MKRNKKNNNNNNNIYHHVNQNKKLDLDLKNHH